MAILVIIGDGYVNRVQLICNQAGMVCRKAFIFDGGAFARFSTRSRDWTGQLNFYAAKTRCGLFWGRPGRRTCAMDG